MEIKKLEIPEFVSGRKVTNRGVHLHPGGFHWEMLKDAPYWTDLLVRMGISWVVILTESDSVIMKSYYNGKCALEIFLDAGIIPIIRELRKFPIPFTDMVTFLKTVEIYGKYGLKPIWLIRNEPFDPREWVNHEVPSNAWDIIMKVWGNAASFIATNGGYVGFPDGPSYSFNPFESIKRRGLQWIFDEGFGFYSGHFYGKNRHILYPYDSVTRYGYPLTEEKYKRALDDFQDDPSWYDFPIHKMNQTRLDWRDPERTIMQDDTCWRAWMKIMAWSETSFGYVVPIAMTEGGWTPRDRAGSGNNIDVRLPYTTPKMVGKKTLQMYNTPSPLFSICPWLLRTDAGWPFDAWTGWAFSDIYGFEKPVINTLINNPPHEINNVGIRNIIDIEGDTRDEAWLKSKYDYSVIPAENPSSELVEIYEVYEPSSQFNSILVDENGVLVEHPPDGTVGQIIYRNVVGETTLYGVWQISNLIDPKRRGTVTVDAYIKGEDVEEPEVKVYGPNGEDWTLDQLKDEFGNIFIGEMNGPGWYVSELHARMKEEPSVICVTAGDGVKIAFYWEHAPAQNCGPANGLPDGSPVEITPGICDIGEKYGEPMCFPIGRGSYYFPEDGEVGPHAIWIAGNDTRSQVISGIGMLGGTNHHHIDVVFEYRESGPPPPPEPPPPPPEPPPPPHGCTYTIVSQEYNDGLTLLMGNIGTSGIAMKLDDPWGNTYETVSGSKPEFGDGGFEFFLRFTGRYNLSFLDCSFNIGIVEGQYTRVNFRKEQ